jgi:hypothetical protein
MSSINNTFVSAINKDQGQLGKEKKIEKKKAFIKHQNLELLDMCHVTTLRTKEMVLYLFLYTPLLLHDQFILIRIYQHKIAV